MDSPYLFDFLQHIAVGAASVFGLLLIIWLGTPRRALNPSSRRITTRFHFGNRPN
jgi:hypothetical protein